MEHRVEPFELADPNLPGYHRSVVLYLVDPHYRVCSTRNVLPQQFHWWAEALSDEFVKLGVPREISTEITRRTDDWLMGMDEATKHRLEMMKEHRWMDVVRYKGMPLYGFWWIVMLWVIDGVFNADGHIAIQVTNPNITWWQTVWTLQGSINNAQCVSFESTKSSCVSILIYYGNDRPQV